MLEHLTRLFLAIVQSIIDELQDPTSTSNFNCTSFSAKHLQERLSWMLKLEPSLPCVDRDLVHMLTEASRVEEGGDVHMFTYEATHLVEPLHSILALNAVELEALMKQAVMVQSAVWKSKFEAMNQYDNHLLALCS